MSKTKSAFIRFKSRFEIEPERFVMIGHNNKVTLSPGQAKLKIKFSVTSFKKYQITGQLGGSAD